MAACSCCTPVHPAGLFSRYIAASPSLWWQGGVILQEEQAFPGAPVPGCG
jgi:predicted alpha/beta superfamily hydrolase